MKKILTIFIICIIVLIGSIYAINININRIGNNLCDMDNTHKQAALVLGAKVWNNGSLSDIFKDRVKTAIELYNKGKVDKILVSGDHGQVEYDEVNTAKEYLLENNIKPEDIFLDHAGFDTYDSLYRAKEIFQADSLIVVTQDFHLPRALYIADKLEIDSCGVSADLQRYYGEDTRNRREVLAKVKAWLNITFNSKPKYLGDVIPLSGSGLDTWD
ncbi:YdcF family protein [archaeon]|jgi:vancomycin permeability regulator SanA|nr:YdcF family protein [archaeon]MDX9778942.1 ElyC/SanA/YdcF family protein [Patescibacteria group bacterium]